MFKNTSTVSRQEHYNRIMAEIKLLEEKNNPTKEDYKKINNLTQISLKLVQRTSPRHITLSSPSVNFVTVGSPPRDPSPIKIKFDEEATQHFKSITKDNEENDEQSDHASVCSSSSYDSFNAHFSVFAAGFEEENPSDSIKSPYR